MTLSTRTKFQVLLRDLFQFDCADLDFGIYRTMNYKRRVIERWITEDLPQAISEELNRGALAEQGQAQEALQTARQKVLDALGEDALDANGNLAEAYRATKAGRAYLETQAKAQGARSTEALAVLTAERCRTDRGDSLVVINSLHEQKGMAVKVKRRCSSLSFDFRLRLCV